MKCPQSSNFLNNDLQSSKPLQLLFLLPQTNTRLTKASCFPFSLVCLLNQHPHTPLCSYKGRMCHLSKSSMTLFLNSCFLQWNKNQTHNKHLGSVQWSLYSFLYVSQHIHFLWNQTEHCFSLLTLLSFCFKLKTLIPIRYMNPNFHLIRL